MGFRGLVTVRRPFHNLLRRTIACGRLTRGRATRGLRSGCRRIPTKPQAASASSMCGGAGASTSIGGFDFESGTTTLRASNCSGQIRARAVDRVAENRPALRSAMDAQLMRASGLGLELEPGDRRAAPCPPSLDAPKRQRLLAFRDRPSSTSRSCHRAGRAAGRSFPLRPRARPRRSPNRSWRSCPA